MSTREPDIIRRKGNRAQVEPYEFGLEFYRDDEPEIHMFKAYPVLDAGSLNLTMGAGSQPEKVIEGMVRSVRKMLADDDGTPANWTLARYEAALEEHDDGSDEYAAEVDSAPVLDEDAPPLCRGINGEPIEWEQAQKLMLPEAGSSRRRFVHLMDVDDDLVLEAEQLRTVYQKLIGRAGKRPTRR